MDLLSAISVAVGVSFVALVAVAMLVAGWEMLRQRELLDQLRRDRALYAASSPLPLGSGGPPPAAPRRAAPSAPTTAAGNLPRDGTWTETRPAVLNFAPAVDDDTAPRRREVSRREVDLQLD